jgi:hypothetical protein
MSISSVNGDLRGDCPIWRSEVEEFFTVGMRIEEKVPPKEVWDGCNTRIYLFYF